MYLIVQAFMRYIRAHKLCTTLEKTRRLTGDRRRRSNNFGGRYHRKGRRPVDSDDANASNGDI